MKAPGEYAIGNKQFTNGTCKGNQKSLPLCVKNYNTIKDPHWYNVQGSDTTMMPIAASLPGQK